MRYFTKELWRNAQDISNEVSHEQWRTALDQYAAQLRAIKPRLGPLAMHFFAEADVHDGELMELTLIDGSRPAPISQPHRTWETVYLPVKARLSVMDAAEELIWTLSYASLRRVIVDYPSEDPLFAGGAQGFGDWGYHELTEVSEQFLRHEILLASGASLLFEFQDVSVESSSRDSSAISLR